MSDSSSFSKWCSATCCPMPMRLAMSSVINTVNLGKHDQNAVLNLVAIGAALLLCRYGEFLYLLAQVLGSPI